MPLGRGGSTPWWVGRFDDVIGARVRQKLSPEASIMPEASPQGSGEIEFLGPLRWGSLTNVQGDVFYPLLGTLGILIPDSFPQAYGGVEHSFRGLRMRDCG
jgi:hypothetical protein